MATIFCIIILGLQAIICGFLAMNIAGHKGHSVGSWFGAGFFFGIFGLIAAAGLPTKHSSISVDGLFKKCPDCAESIRIEALVCKYCGKKFASTSDSEDSFEERILCDDGNCIGVIGPDGFCKVCGKLSQDTATNTIGGDVKTLLKRGLTLSNSGQYSEALKAYEYVLQVDPKQELAYYYRAVVYNKIGDSSQAIKDLKSAAKLGHIKSQELLKSKGVK